MYKGITIIGGEGKMGKMFAKNFIKQGLQVEVVDQQTSQTDLLKKIKQTELVVVSVPMQMTLQILNQVNPHLTEKQSLIELSSVKNHTKSFVPLKCSFIPVHPLFGPQLKDWNGNNLIIISDQETLQLKKLKTFFETFALHVVVLDSPERHDKYMSLIQGLTHFIHILFAQTLQSQDAQLEELLQICSPVYRAYFSFSCRIISQNPDLYTHILVDNPQNVETIENLIENSNHLLHFMKNKDTEQFNQLFKNLKHFLGDLSENFSKQSEILVEKLQEIDQKKL